MKKIGVLKIIIVFCWYVLFPVVGFVFYRLSRSGVQVGYSFTVGGIISFTYIWSVIIGLVLYSFLLIRSLIKLIYYRNYPEKKFFYRKKLIYYSTFLLIILIGWYIARWAGRITAINIGGEHDLIPQVMENY